MSVLSLGSRDVPVAGFGEDLAVLMELACDNAVKKSTNSTALSGFLILTLVLTAFELNVGFFTLCIN